MNQNKVEVSKAWTIMRVESPDKPEFCAMNTVTGERMPLRGSYDRAFDDIPNGEEHNWIGTAPIYRSKQL